ncbi:hypothetical protein [Moorena producens]
MGETPKTALHRSPAPWKPPVPCSLFPVPYSLKPTGLITSAK